MKKDITPPKVEDIAVAIVREPNEQQELVWNVYLLNMKNETIEGVIVSSKGYGQKNGENVKTSMLRHFLDTLEPGSFSKVEPIMEDVFALSNEYWVSFFLNNAMYDKKYVFVAGSIAEENFTTIPLIKKKGVMIR
jgi:hypothetical protein